MRLLKTLLAPMLFLVALLWRPIRARSRRKALQKYGWLELQLEGAAPGGDQFQILDLLLVGAEELLRQTDGLGFVVSHRTVLEFHMHSSSPFVTTAMPLP